MKVLCEFENCGPSFVTEGWRKVFEALGHSFTYWVPSAKPAFDAFGEVEPDLFIGKTFTLSTAVYKNIASRPDMKVILCASAWGELIDEIDTKEYPISIASEAEKSLLAKLKEAAGKPDFVFLHYHDNWIERTLGGWRSIGIKPVSMLNAADTFDYYPGRAKPEFASALAFVGGYWPYKSKNLNKFLLPLCYNNVQRLSLNIKIFGNQPWPVPQYLGYVDNSDVRDIFASAFICPNISEPHSTQYGFDIVERPFKVLASGAFCISDYVKSAAEDVFGDSVPTFSTLGEFVDLIEYYLRSPEKRLPLVEKGRKFVLDKHTYWDRVASMFTHLDMTEEATRTLELKETYVRQNSMLESR